MKCIIEVEENIKVHHQIYVEYEDEQQLDSVLDNENNQVYDLNDFIDNLERHGIKVNKVNNNYSEDFEPIKYFDNYAED